jgi:hypothetical protein
LVGDNINESKNWKPKERVIYFHQLCALEFRTFKIHIPPMSTNSKRASVAGLLVALGIIYGDIGTSPLYTLQTILTEGGKVDPALVYGANT